MIHDKSDGPEVERAAAMLQASRDPATLL